MIEQATALTRWWDQMLYGNCFETPDGERIAPRSVLPTRPPGSAVAVLNGCRCDPYENRDGKVPYVVASKCPLHGFATGFAHPPHAIESTLIESIIE